MKNDGVIYEKIYHILKNKINSGLIPYGANLPSRAKLCTEYHISEKTARHVITLLADAGYIETAQRKRPTVIFDHANEQDKVPVSLKKADATAADDILKTGILLCYPLIIHGISLCSGDEWKIPETIAGKMDTKQEKGFWQMANQFWRFFISRSGNEFILRAVDSLGLAELNPLPGTAKQRSKYYVTLKEYLHAVRHKENTKSIHFDDFSSLYSFIPDRKNSRICRVAPESPLRTGTKGLNDRLNNAEERYSGVYLDILGLIAVGRYRPGDRLPNHTELQKIYGVSVDTTLRAFQVLQEWGVVEAIRGKGIFVSMDLKALSKIRIDPDLIACHIRRYLDSLELLSLTIEGTAALAAVCVTAEEAIRLKDKIDDLWNNAYLYQRSPIVLLEFLIDHIQYDALRAIYRVILKNYQIGRQIPKLISHDKNKDNLGIHRGCMETVDFLIEGASGRFAKRAAQLYQHIHRLIIEECIRLGYWEAAMRVYDGSTLWK